MEEYEYLVIIPLGQFTTAEQDTLIKQCKQQIAPAYWKQPGCFIMPLPNTNSCLLMAHKGVISQVLNFVAAVDSVDSSPLLP